MLLLELVNSLNSAQKKAFELHLHQKNKRSDVKNILLFQNLSKAKMPRMGLEYLSKGAYHALCKRLQDSLLHFLATQEISFKNDTHTEEAQYLGLAKKYFDQGQTSIALKIVKKISKNIILQEDANLHHEYLLLKITYFNFFENLNFELLMQEYLESKKRLDLEEKIFIFSKSVSFEMANSDKDITSLLKENLTLFSLELNAQTSYTFFVKVLELANTVSYVNREYANFIDFLEEKFRLITPSNTTKPEEQFWVYYYLANFNFRCGRLSTAQQYLLQIQTVVSNTSPVFFEKYTLKHQLLVCLTEIFSGKAKGVLKAYQAMKFNSKQTHIEEVLDLKLTVALAAFLTEDYKKTFQILNEFYKTTQWYISKMGTVWVVKKSLLELLLLVELKEFDLYISRLNAFRKKFKTTLEAYREFAVLDYLKLLTAYFKDESTLQLKKNNTTKKAIFAKIKNRKDVFSIAFYSWFEAKEKQSSLYGECLTYVKQNTL